MLVLTRKRNERITITPRTPLAEPITITVVRISPSSNWVRIGIEAEPDAVIVRTELLLDAPHASREAEVAA